MESLIKNNIKIT